LAAAGFDHGSWCTVVGHADQSAASMQNGAEGTLTSLYLYFELFFFPYSQTF